MTTAYTLLLCLTVLVLPALLLALVWSAESRAAFLGFLELSLRRVQALFHPHPALAWIAWAKAAHRGSLARAFIAEAARTGDPEGWLEEGLLYWEGGLGAGGRSTAVDRFRRAAEAGQRDAMYWLAEDLRWGLSRPADLEGALAWLRRGAQSGSGACAATLVGILVHREDEGSQTETGRWEGWLAATKADPRPRRSVAIARAGEPETDPLTRHVGAAVSQAEAWFERPEWRPLLPWIGWFSILVIAGAAIWLFLLPILFGGIFAIPMLVALAVLVPMGWKMRREHRPGQAIREHFDRAQTGDAEAAYRMGMACLKGQRGLPRDPAEARRWMGLAADRGHVAAMVELADLLRWNLGGFKDVARAEAWLRRAAEAGHEGAKARLVAPEPPTADSGQPT